MAKYSEEFKLKLVNEYLEGSLGYAYLAKKYGMPNKTPIQNWVRAYKNFGIDGLRRKHSKRFYSVQFKLDVLNFMKRTGSSYNDTANAFKLDNSSIIATWKAKLVKEGVEGLLEKRKGRRPSMSKKRGKQDTELSHEEILERENELLRLENAYLKKLKAFQENPNAFLEKHKLRWHSNSKKKDLN